MLLAAFVLLLLIFPLRFSMCFVLSVSAMELQSVPIKIWSVTIYCPEETYFCKHVWLMMWQGIVICCIRKNYCCYVRKNWISISSVSNWIKKSNLRNIPKLSILRSTLWEVIMYYVLSSEKIHFYWQYGICMEPGIK